MAKSHWSSNTARLNRESFLPFGSCGLCLGIAREPVSCRRGDIFCRECALANIIAQKRDIKRANKARQGALDEAAKVKALEDQQEKERTVQEFELTQAGLDLTKRGSAAVEATEVSTPGDSTSLVRTKRKFELDQDELDRITREDKIKARKAIDEEKVCFNMNG